MIHILKLNLLLGLLTIGIAIMVVCVWIPPILQDLRKHGRTTPASLLQCGIVIGFLSVIGDNVFWAITWYAKMAKWPTEQWWFDHGPWSNLLFMHLGKMAAGCFHLEAARRAHAVGTENLAMRSAEMTIGATIVWWWLLLQI